MDTTSPSAGPMPARSASSELPDAGAPVVIALAGNPNAGKTTVFNHLTGLRQKVGNYPGVTVERVEGRTHLPDGQEARVIDLPGCYSLVPRSEDELVARRVLMGLDARVPRPDAVVVVVDATNLARNLFFLSQVLETGTPVVVALTMMDVVRRTGPEIRLKQLQAELGVPVVPVEGRSGVGMDALRQAIGAASSPGRLWRMPEATEEVLADVARALRASNRAEGGTTESEALRLLANDSGELFGPEGLDTELDAVVTAGRARLEDRGLDVATLEAEGRYAWTRRVLDVVQSTAISTEAGRSERIDRLLLHRVIGPITFVAVMGLIFTAVYSWAAPFMEWIEAGTSLAQVGVRDLLGPGTFTDMLADGVVAGVGNVVIFLPQICLLFLFLAILEDVGYLARAAFLIDRVMRVAGLSGKSFVPLMSSFACAIPGIMSARTIENRRDRMVTILVAPLMSCSARLPVYALLIAAFVPSGYQGLTLLAMYLLSVVMALLVALVLRKTLFRGESGTFMLELPPYRLPALRQVLRTVASRGKVFVREAGTIILAISVLLWFLAAFPHDESIRERAEQRVAEGEDLAEVADWEASEQLRQSFAGRIGRAIEPAVEPLGYDWKTGIGLVASFAAREVMVSTLGIVYSVGEADEESTSLRQKLRDDRHEDGRPVHTLLTSISLMVFFVLACQCMSTLAVVKRETNSWRWPMFMFAYMTALAWAAAFAVYQGGMLLGFGP